MNTTQRWGATLLIGILALSLTGCKKKQLKRYSPFKPVISTERIFSLAETIVLERLAPRLF